MESNQRRNRGGLVRGAQLKKEALDRYNANPNFCRHCGKKLVVPDGVRVSDFRKNKFCNHSCAAYHGNKFMVGVRRGPLPTTKHLNCKYCEKSFPVKGSARVRKYCSLLCALFARGTKPLLERTKSDLFTRASSWQAARSTIQSHARRTYLNGTPKDQQKCFVCGYSTFVDAAHIRSVSDFPDTALISEINRLNNLVGLCKNHHAEYDMKILVLHFEEPKE